MYPSTSQPTALIFPGVKLGGAQRETKLGGDRHRVGKMKQISIVYTHLRTEKGRKSRKEEFLGHIFRLSELNEP